MQGISKTLPVDLRDTDNITNTWENIKISRLHCTVWNLDKTKGQGTSKPVLYTARFRYIDVTLFFTIYFTTSAV